MDRTRILFLALAFVLALPAAASAQLPYVPARLVDPALVEPPERIPPAPRGEYPEDWAACVSETRPSWPAAPAGIDPRGVDPALPNPLLGQRFFVDRMEPAYMQWARWKRAGRTAEADTIWRLAREPRFRWFWAWLLLLRNGRIVIGRMSNANACRNSSPELITWLSV
jgi:hypothetical protein